MSKKLIVAIVLLAALVLVYALTRQAPPRVVGDAEWSVAGAESIDKLEVSDGKLRYVFEKRGGIWRQTEPVDAPASGEAFEKVEALFAAGIDADLTASAGAELGEYELAGENVKHVRVYAAGSELANFAVGKSVTVPNSNARRTWVLPDGSENAFRAYTTAEGVDLAAVLGRDIQGWREKKILALDADSIVALRLGGGDAAPLQLVKDTPAADGGGDPAAAAPAPEWRIAQPEGIPLDRGRASAMVSTLANFAVDGFADGVSPADAGLEPAWRTLAVKTTSDGKDNELVLELGRKVKEGPEPDSAPDDDARYLRVADQPFVYVVRGSKVTNLAMTVGALRDKLVLQLERDAIAQLAASGAEPYTLNRTESGWKLLVGEAESVVDETKLASTLSSLANLRAMDFPEVPDLAATGLDAPEAYSLTVTMNDGRAHTIVLGGKVAEDKEDLFARVDGGIVFSLSSYVAGNLRKSASELSGL